MTNTEVRRRFEREAARLRPILLRIVTSITGRADEADDIAQETLLKLWFLRDSLDKYASIDAPARVIARNLSLNALRDRKPTLTIDDCDLRNMAVDERDGETLSEELALAIAKLPGTEQAVLRMKHIEGMETEEIAALIGSTAGAVRSALSRGRERIRKLFLSNTNKYRYG